MSERDVLALIANSRGAYEQYATYLEDEDFSSVGRTIYGFIKDYYERDPTVVNVDSSAIHARMSSALVKGGAELNGILDWSDVSLPNVEDAVRKQQLQARGYQLAEILLTNDTEHATLSTVLEQYYSIYNNTYIQSSTRDTDADILDLLKEISTDSLYKLYPRSLNDQLEGGVPKGTTITVFARPEVGKTLFCINAAAGFCRDGHKVLYCGNEDPKSKMMARIISRMSELTKDAILDSPKDALAAAKDKGLGNLDFRALTPGTIGEVDALVKQTVPDIVIVDQVFNLAIKGAEVNSIQAIRQISPAMRQIAKARDVVMLQVCQAGDSGDGKIELGMGDIEGTNTAHQAQQDIIIGIGASPQMLQSGHRRFSFPKNKESGQHGTIPVRFEEAINKVHSI